MRKRIVVVDGYNVIFRTPGLKGLMERSREQARNALLRRCGAMIAARRDVWRYCVVFDGDSSVFGDSEGAAPGVTAIYSRSGETADDRILQLLDEQPRDCDCVVVTDDAEVAGRSRQRGADVLSVGQFIGPAPSGPRNPLPAAGGDDKNSLSAAEQQEINRELIRRWGVE
jgi:predicted RNA-binding protein with PIN domain